MHVPQHDEAPVSNRDEIIITHHSHRGGGRGESAQSVNLLAYPHQESVQDDRDDLIFGAGHAFFFSSNVEAPQQHQHQHEHQHAAANASPLGDTSSFSGNGRTGVGAEQLDRSTAFSGDSSASSDVQYRQHADGAHAQPEMSIQMQELHKHSAGGVGVPEGAQNSQQQQQQQQAGGTDDAQSHDLQLSRPTTQYPRWLPWACLTASLVWGGIMPPWIQSIPAERYLRICWRFFMTSLWLVPLVIWESRQPQYSSKYTRENILNKENMKKVLLTSFGSSLWFSMYLFSFSYTSVSHGTFLANLANFFISIRRTCRANGTRIEMEIVGQIMVVIGIVMVIADSATMDILQSDHRFSFRLTQFLTKPVWQRIILGDLVALLAGLWISYISAIDRQVKSIFPPYLALFFLCIFATAWMSIWSFFMGIFGVSETSWFRLFSADHFWTFLLLSFFCGLGLFISYMYVAKFFEPVVSSSVLLFEPILSTIFMFCLGLQTLPGPIACLGYVFMLPGHFLLILTRYLQQVKKKA